MYHKSFKTFQVQEEKLTLPNQSLSVKLTQNPREEQSILIDMEIQTQDCKGTNEVKFSNLVNPLPHNHLTTIYLACCTINTCMTLA